MKKAYLLLCLIFTLMLMTKPDLKSNDYVLIGWNDLGMHCANKDFSLMAILPPYNNINAQLIKKGDASHLPQIVTTGYKVTYEIPGNTYSVGKTNFWSFVQKLFGVLLENNKGLKGAGLSGDMLTVDNHFYIEGVPITPYTDADLNNEDPFQLALLKAYDSQGNLLTTTRTVVPVSNEISCVSSGCHSSEQSIINEHPDEEEGGFNKNNTPVLCANCHASNALGTTGIAEARPLSFRIHDQHSDKTNDCYKCHPGEKTRCFRDVMFSKGLKCQNCHGDVSNVAKTIEENNRRPWLDEPKCGASNCHGSNFAEEAGKLFRQSKGHSQVYCSGCHGSPHAILPSTNDRDNVQNIALQGYAGTLSKCSVCHGVSPTDAGPHGFFSNQVSVKEGSLYSIIELLQNYPNPFSGGTNIPFKLNRAGKVRLEIINESGITLSVLLNDYLPAGDYTVPVNYDNLVPGMYIYRLKSGGTEIVKKMSVVR